MKNFKEVKTIYDKVFKNINGYAVSLNERNSKINDNIIKDVLYGESPIELLYALLNLDCIKQYIDTAKNFYDLGSGIGNVTIGAYLTKNFEKCTGIELLNSLYELSLVAKRNINELDQSSVNKINFEHNNILYININDADIVYFSCPTKNNELRLKMEEKFVKELKSGTLIFSLIHVFSNKTDFELITARMVRSAWGEAPMMIYIKK